MLDFYQAKLFGYQIKFFYFTGIISKDSRKAQVNLIENIHFMALVSGYCRIHYNNQPYVINAIFVKQQCYFRYFLKA